MILRRLTILVLFALMIAVGSHTLAAEPLPKSMSGQWFLARVRGQVSGDWSVVIDKQDDKGAIEGRLTHHGFNCGAKDEPMTGSFDGSVLRLVSKLRANVNVKNPGRDCGSGKTTWTLNRQKNGSFEGEGLWEGGGPTFSFMVDLKP
jgi:hypothetical protein